MFSATHCGAGGPIGRQHDKIRAEDRQRPGRFGKGCVVADIHPHAQVARLMDGKRPVAVGGEHVHSQVGQMHFAIRADHSLGPDEHRCVEDIFAVAFEHAEDDVSAVTRTRASELFGGRPRNCFRDCPGFVKIGKAIAGERTLGKDGEERPRSRGGFKPLEHLLQVGFHLAERNIHLHAGNFHGMVPSRMRTSFWRVDTANQCARNTLPRKPCRRLKEG